MVSEEVVNVQCLSTWTRYNYLLVDRLNQYDTPQFSSSMVLLIQSFQLSKTYMCLCVSEALLILVELSMKIHIKYQSCFSWTHEFQASFKQREMYSSSSFCTITTKMVSNPNELPIFYKGSILNGILHCMRLFARFSCDLAITREQRAVTVIFHGVQLRPRSAICHVSPIENELRTRTDGVHHVKCA